MLKFDIIIDNMGWYLIDIGFDPPKRLEAIMQYKNKNFTKHMCIIGLKIRIYLINLI